MPDERARILTDAAAKLTARVSDLVTEVDQLGDRLHSAEELAKANAALVKANAERVKSNERKANMLRILLAFDMLLTVLAFYLGWTLFETNIRLDAVCPLYAFNLGTYAPQSRAPGADRDLYIQSFDKMRIKFADLGCGPEFPLVPGAAHPPTAAPGNN